MNKRIEKIVLKAKESKNNLATPRRDQIKKAVEEKAFDYMIYKGYDEIYDVEPVKMAAVLENIENYWLTDGSMWASVNDDVLKVTIKYGYSYLTLYADLKEDKKPSLNTVESKEVEIIYNEEKNGIEVKFNNKPAQEVINSLKANGFRWHRVKKVWYAKQTEERINYINTTFKINQINDEKEVNNIIELNDYRNESEDIKDIVINPNVVEVKEQDQYFIKSVKFANLNKRNTIKEYEKEIIKGDYLFQDVKITRELYFNNIEELESFNNSLMLDFDFIDGTGGSCTDDERINDIKDYWNMSDEERDTVKWYLKGIAVYFNNELQYIIDAQGYSYARYVGLVWEHTKNEKKVIEEVEEEKIEMEMNFDDILESFENVEIKNENRLCEEDLKIIQEKKNNLEKMKESFNTYLEFYKNSKLLSYDGEVNNMIYNFKKDQIIPNFQYLISDVYNYFNKKYSLNIEKLNTKELIKNHNKFKRYNTYERDFEWYMNVFNIDMLIDDIFNKLNGISFKEMEIKLLKEKILNYSWGVNVKGKKVNLKEILNFNVYQIQSYNNYILSGSERIENIFKLLTYAECNNFKNDCFVNVKELIKNAKENITNTYKLEGEKIQSIKIFKNGSIQITFNSGLNALEFAQEYLNYKEVA
ncbi:hypothetical protein ACOT7R_16355 [Clostridium perfringens]|uniref:hypothetical protein n=1 Tax=Clostridium perfringens TaxID=1502 RepID=UPI003BA8DA63